MVESKIETKNSANPRSDYFGTGSGPWHDTKQYL